jgi:hypothetical protein
MLGAFGSQPDPSTGGAQKSRQPAKPMVGLITARRMDARQEIRSGQHVMPTSRSSEAKNIAIGQIF